MLVLLVALIVAASSVVGPLLLARQLNKQRQLAAKEKAEDRRREDEVAAEALRQQQEVATTAAKAAELLRQAQLETTRGTDEVARGLAAAGDSSPAKAAVQEATPVVLFYPNGQREDVVLSGVPRVGERIRLANGREAAALIVEAVLWMEAFLPPPNPSVIVVVRPETRQESDSGAPDPTPNP